MSVYQWGALEWRAFVCGVLVGAGVVVAWWRAFDSDDDAP